MWLWPNQQSSSPGDHRNLGPRQQSRYGKLRREPRREALSTLEAAALALRHLEARPEAADALLAALGHLMAAAQPTQPASA